MDTTKVSSALEEYQRNPSRLALERLLERCRAVDVRPAWLLDRFRQEVARHETKLLPRQRLARVLLEAGHLIEALHHINACITRWPQDPVSLRLACLIAVRAADHKQAVKHLRELRQLDDRAADRVVFEAAFGQRFGCRADWNRLGHALVVVATSEPEAIQLAVQIAIRQLDVELACAAARRFADLRPGVTLSKHQGHQLQELVRRRLLGVLQEKPS